MTKRAFDKIMDGLADVKAMNDGAADVSTYRVHVPEEVDVKTIRAREGLSQAGFAKRYGFSPGAVRHWEQGKRKPDAAARVLLTVIAKEPEAVHRALAGG